MAIIKKNIGILGGGIAGLSLAHFLHDNSVAIIEKAKKVGGLCRSYKKNGLSYDVGPHIIFSKNDQVLKFMSTVIKTHQLRRMNRVFLDGRFVNYPFENFLAMLKDKNKIEYCLDTFLNNPYQNMQVDNMLAFFLKTFGEGITKLYLQPYNEKIWKFDPAMLDTQMVERIPKPPKQHIIESARGKFSEGYTHQLNFFYPIKDGYQGIIDAICEKLMARGKKIMTDEAITSIKFKNKHWIILTKKNHYESRQLVNCMPIHELIKLLKDVPANIHDAVDKLLYNSIYIIVINVKKDTTGKHFAVTIPQKDVIFHRISKLDFLGERYHLKDSTSFLLEITYRQGDQYHKMSRQQLINRCIADLVKIGFIKNREMVNFTDFHREKYAYVIYDLNHRKHVDIVLKFLRNLGIESNGRWAEFEYMNSDKVIEHSIKLAEKINAYA